MHLATTQGLALGLDGGSVALKVVITDANGNLLDKSYTRTHGKPIETAVAVLQKVLDQYGADAFTLLAGTGSSGRFICQLLGIPFVNEVICQATAIKHLSPEVRSLIEMGGQDSKLVYLPAGPSNGRPMVDFAMNTNCAAGTGSFLDQQASRLGIAIEGEFAELALRSKTPPRVAGRCSVFAKSDMIHLQQQAAPVHDIVAGLCLGLARNLKTNLGRAVELPKPIAFCGGVAANQGVVRAMEEVFQLQPGQLIVPDCHAVTGALGAVLVIRKEHSANDGHPAMPVRLDLTALRQHLSKPRNIGHRLDQLMIPSDGHPDGSLPSRQELEARAKDQPIDAWLGLDVGSISTKVAVIDINNRVLAKIYLMTAGRPLEACRHALRAIGQQVGGLVRIVGAATTGSGRYLTGDFIGADLVINEITAQAIAAATIDPQVDTIFEIGGQDSKYIGLDGGVVVDFEMNHACAAGTGSFLEEQAERLGVSIKGQFGELALASRNPIRLGERCTVFMESDLLSHQQQGAQTPDLVAGLCYSIVSNYINRVVGHRRIGKRVFFQGGTAFNQGVVAAFEKVTGLKITVPPHHEVTGAMGAAVLARRHQEQLGTDVSAFGGFELADAQHQIRSFECDKCSNNCEINEVSVPGRPALYYGSRCDLYNVKKDRAASTPIPNLFAERQRMLFEHAGLPMGKAATAKAVIKPSRPTVGIPLALSNYQLLPLWGTLLRELDLNVVVTPVTSPATVARGVESVLSTPCFPVKLAHGHVMELVENGVDFLWLPSVISMGKDYAENEYNQLCPYVTALPYQITAALEARGATTKMLKPPIRFEGGQDAVHRQLKCLVGQLPITRSQLRNAVAKAWQAQQAFEDACRARGKQILDNLTPEQRAVVIISRPYNGCDLGACLDLPAKLRKLRVLPIPMDFLDLRDNGTPSNDRVVVNMYWKYGQRILRAAQVVRDDPQLHAVYVSNFSCGPDSFLITFFKRMMAPKPSLVLEIDEHSADAGVVTRLEAFLESLSNCPPGKVPIRLPLYLSTSDRNHQPRKIYVPWMGDQSYALAAAFRAFGQDSDVMGGIPGQHNIELGRRVCSGKECLPCIITTGDMIRVTQQPGFDPDRTAFFMPGGSGPCRFGQYNSLQKLVLDDLGFPQVPIISVSQDKEFYDDFKQFTGNPVRLGWCGICTTEMLHKALLAIRPYERTPGQTDRVYHAAIARLCRLIEKKPSDSQLTQEMALAARDFAAIDVDRSQRRPVIGVLGEVYVRLHRMANDDLLRQLERLGAQTTLTGFPEWVLYTNWIRMDQAARGWHPRQWLTSLVQDQVQRRLLRRFGRPFHSLLGNFEEASTRDILKLAEPYIHRSFEGEAVLSVGKMIEFAHQGCHGVVNVMPFSCMPSTVVSGLMKKVTQALGQMPSLSISYDGQQDPMLTTRLEAFIYQAKAQMAKH